MKPLGCRYCKRDLLPLSRDKKRDLPLSATRDHVIAKSRGGTKTDTCCRQCNQLKGGMSLIDWARFMQSNPEWWLRFRTHGQVLKADPDWPTRKARKTAAYRLRAIRKRLETCPVNVPFPPLCRGLAS